MDEEQELTPEQEAEREEAYREWKRRNHIANYSSPSILEELLDKHPLSEFKENE